MMGRPVFRRWLWGGAVLLLVIAMFLGTKIVPAGSTLGGTAASFDAASYGKKQFPIQQKYVQSHAVNAGEFAAAVVADQAAAAKKYGVSLNSGTSTIVCVKLTGVVGTVPAAGFTPVTVSGLPADLALAVQLGPAITGTDLRDASGKIPLGQFENQIQFQDAGTAINNELKILLKKAGAPNLTGKTIVITGAFQLINPKLWNITPASIEVKP
jgi:predicted lipoprotein